MYQRPILPAALLAVSLFTTPLQATTVVPPANLGQLARMSGAVVFGQAVESWVEAEGTVPSTVTRFHLLEQVAGASPGFVFEVREPGGALGRKGAAVAGAPRFAAGKNYLLFLDPAPGGRWRSKMMAYGLLEEEASGLLRPLPQAAHIEAVARKSFEPVGVYRKENLLAHLREVARGAPWSYQRATAGAPKGDFLQTAGAPLSNAPANCVFLTDDGGDGRPIRWFGYEDGSQTTTLVATTPGQTGVADGGASAVQQGIAAWANHSDSVLRFVAGSPRARSVTCSGNFDYDENAAVFNDPCNDLADLSGCSGTLAFGGAIYDNNTTRLYDGELWHPAIDTFVVVNNGAECVGEVNFKEILTHELGHTQGFGHHNPPNHADATMSAFLKGDGRGAAIASVDKACASYAYHTFLDVPYSHMFWRQIEAIENASITKGCGVAAYCPESSISRAEMSVFMVRGSHGSGFAPPPATGTMFTDVPSSFWAAAFVEQLATDGISRGCGTGVFCPNATVTRAQMAIFLVRVRHGSGFVPPPATGTVFADVPADYWAAPYVEQLYTDGITGGCATTPARRYCPDDNVSRGEMAVFLARVYNLPLP